MNIGDIAVVPFTLAITQAIKNIFNVDGKANMVVALVVATVLSMAALLINQELVSPQVALWIQVVISSVGGGLSAIGLFDYVRDELKISNG